MASQSCIVQTNWRERAHANCDLTPANSAMGNPQIPLEPSRLLKCELLFLPELLTSSTLILIPLPLPFLWSQERWRPRTCKALGAGERSGGGEGGRICDILFLGPKSCSDLRGSWLKGRVGDKRGQGENGDQLWELDGGLAEEEAMQGCWAQGGQAAV